VIPHLVEFKMEIWFNMRVPTYATVEEQARRLGGIKIKGPSTTSGDFPLPFRPQKVTLNLVILLTFPCFSARAQDLQLHREQAKWMLRQVSQDVERNFYDPSLRGLDWQRLTAQASKEISRSNSWGDMFLAIFALLDSLHDSHTVFVAPQRNVKREFGFEAKPYGDKILIYKVKENGPAWEAGLRPGDELLTINGFRAERSTFFQLMLYLRALHPVDVMQLRASRDGGPPSDVEVRAKMTSQPRVMEVFDAFNFNQLLREAEDQQKQFNDVGYDDLGNAVGYVRVASFMADRDYLYSVMKKARDSRVVVVDLRGNLGGAIEDLKFLAGFFVEQPTEIAQAVGRNRTESLTAKPEHPTIAGPMIVLVDSETASAGEMFARYFQISRRAVVVGDKTSGRVNAASYFSEKVGQDTIIPYGVEVAVARVLLPGGEELENRGVNPDHLCIPTPAELREKRDPCKALALSLARQSANQSAPPSPGPGR